MKLNQKGMEMWEIVIIILAIILLLAVIIWYGFLGGEIKNLFSVFEGL